MLSTIRWTNKSVLRLAGTEDPIEVLEQMARQLVLKAMDQGWSGPPFSQVRLADLLGIPVEANNAVRDAQTVATEQGLRIRYNPTQARERVRFSIAHEIAHSLFPDCAERVRKRGGDDLEIDDWQLELLCNIGAAELTMPLGSFAKEGPVPPLEDLLVERRAFDVSAEAYLIRVAKIATEPLMMFAASPSYEQGHTSYRIDYCVPSPTWDGPKLQDASFDDRGVIGECKSIGFSSRGEERWPDLGDVYVEAVGVPAFPGARLPRVVGLLHAEVLQRKQPLEFLQGDILRSRDNRSRVVCQLVNDQARVWGGGVARESARRWPDAQADFAQWCDGVPRSDRLGKVHFWRSETVVLASLVAQHGLRSTAGPMIKYSALDACFKAVGNLAVSEGLPVYMPRLGTGAAGGNWQVVEQLVLETLVDRSIEVTVVDLPPKRQAELTL